LAATVLRALIDRALLHDPLTRAGERDLMAVPFTVSGRKREVVVDHAEALFSYSCCHPTSSTAQSAEC
jgi:hypothetical protein